VTVWLDRLSGQLIEALPEGPRFAGRYLHRESRLWDMPNPDGGDCDDFLGEAIALDQARDLDSTVVGLVVASWGQLETAKPLVRTEDIDVQWSKRDGELENAVHLVERICRDPHSLLTTVTELEPVHRVRRARPTALAYLAAHTEDWLHRGVVSVRPRRVLSERRHTVLNVYENRLVARLIDRVLKKLKERIDKLTRRAILYKEVQASLDGDLARLDTTLPWHWRARRLCEIWGDDAIDQTRETIARETREKLEDVFARATACRLSELYQSVSRHAPMGRLPHITNVLRSERRYRHAREHWVALAHAEEAEVQPNISADFAIFALLLVVRGLAQLRFEQVEANTKKQLVVDNGAGPVSVDVDERGIRLSRDGELLVRLVPMPVCIDTLSPQDLLALDEAVPFADRARTAFLSWDAVQRDTSKVPISPRLSPSPVLQLGLARERPSRGSSIGVLPVSPWTLGSDERVARALRWYLLGPRFEQYPPLLSCPPSTLGVNPKQLDLEGGRLLSATLDLKAIDRRVEELDQAYEQACLDAESAHAEFQRARKGRKDSSELDKRRADARGLSEQANRDFISASEWRAQLVAALPVVKDVVTCPVCSKRGERRRHDNETFAFECPGCATSWGVRKCGICKQRLPYIEPPHLSYVRAKPIDVTFGQDVLAVFAVRGGSVCARCADEPSQEQAHRRS